MTLPAARALLVAAVVAAAPVVAAQTPAQQLTRPVQFWNPDWSPDGKSLVFESTMDGPYSVYTIGADGRGLRRLTADTANNEQPRWSPDGRRIAFSSDRTAGHLDIWIMNADGSGQTQLVRTPGGGYYGARFSPDGRWIVFQGRPDNAEVRDRAYLVGSDGAGLRQLSDSAYGADGPRWSADGKTISFRQVPYPRRLWAELQEGDVARADSAARYVSVRLDGSGLAPATRAQPKDGRPQPDAAPAPGGHRFAYTKTVDGFAGLYLYDASTRAERLLVGGPGAGPLGYLRTASLTPRVDTIDTYSSPRGSGPIEHESGAAFVVRSVKQVGARRWEVSSTWHDSAGAVTAVQTSRNARGSVATDLETVRAITDSASLLVTGDRVTGWVVPAGQPARLVDGPAAGERFAREFVTAGIARAHPANGQWFLTTGASLYGGNPLEVTLDSLQVVRRDTLYRGSVALPVIVLGRGSGQIWVEESTGAELLSRGNAQPGRWWWHIRRGVQPPARF